MNTLISFLKVLLQMAPHLVDTVAAAYGKWRQLGNDKDGDVQKLITNVREGRFDEIDDAIDDKIDGLDLPEK